MALETRIVRNTARIGKKFLLVRGRYKAASEKLNGNDRRWVTIYQLEDFNTRAEADAALVALTKA